MNDILSQDEVDALLKGMKDGDVEAEPKEVPDDIRPYDLTSQERIIRGRMPGLENVNDRFARLLRVSLSNFIGKFIDITAQSVTLMKFGEFMRNVPLPSSINIFRLNPLKGYALLILEAPLVFAVVEYFFGGNGSGSVKTEGRNFTPVEQRLINKLLGMALSDLESAWNVITDVKTEFTGSETNPQFVNILSPIDVIIKVEFHIEMETFTGKLYLGIPYSLIEPLKEKLHSGITGENESVDNRWVDQLVQLLDDSLVNISVELDRTELSIAEILNLNKGDVITLGKSAGSELRLMVDGVLKFYCLAGSHKGSQAVKITGTINNNHNN
ncbi:flagellar motor switch protein FliM [bacterium BMS3Bbin06]|nr:flagellar motor switch protein FliM [bacterium BMS3Abin08]GBE33817.1 flagellar motor switch protein FliM [bacterium BMS3Bbin06]HDO35753.1 flagellar motor switch protein FliM [Nitrospirota bacterium]HDY72045.1 flagellar motor switch protein FliM [Nitrospirota bacterium]